MPILHEPLDLVQRLIILLILGYYRLLVFLPRLGHGSMLRAASADCRGQSRWARGLARGVLSAAWDPKRGLLAIGALGVCVCVSRVRWERLYMKIEGFRSFSTKIVQQDEFTISLSQSSNNQFPGTGDLVRIYRNILWPVIPDPLQHNRAV